MAAVTDGKLLAVSDLHVSYRENRELVDAMRPESDEDWLLVAGDIGELVSDVERTLKRLSERFARVVWAPGNHELWTHPNDPVTLRGEHRYRHLVELCRGLGVVTPEDPYPVWRGHTIAPLFLLYDYSFRDGGTTMEQALERAYQAGVVCTDEFLLHPDPYPSRQAWCHARVEQTQRRLATRDPRLPTVLVSHFPLVREPTLRLWHQEFALWCGTERTADWHRRFDVAVAVFGHLHIPGTLWHDGVRFEEVSLGYPREWGRRPAPPRIPRQVLPLEG
jgi:predicted phosphodiesterase